MRRELEINVELEIELIVMELEKKRLLLELDKERESHSAENSVKLLIVNFLNEEIKKQKLEIENRDNDKIERDKPRKNWSREGGV